MSMGLACREKETASAFALEMHLRVRWAMGCSVVVVAPNLGAAGATLVGGAGIGEDVTPTL